MSATQRDYDHLFKLLIIGDSGVGKSSMLLRYTDRTFNTSFIATVGVDFKVVYLNLGNQRIKLQIWDTAGQERFKTITATYYRGTHGVIVVYDVTNRVSFDNVKRWLSELETNCDNVVCILVGNKCDLESRREVTSDELRNFASSNDRITAFFEVSAYLSDNNGLEVMFQKLASTVLQKKLSYCVDQPVIKPGDTEDNKPAVKRKRTCLI